MATVKVNRNRNAFLDMIAWSEGTAGRGDDGYNVIVTGIDRKLEFFDDYSDHPFNHGRPSKIINSKGLTSNASGRYQFMLKDWHYYRDLLNLPDFGPESQDKWAIRLIRECRALPDIDAGRIETAIRKVARIWASFPGANYGQHENAMTKCLDAYVAAGGTFSRQEG